jgi:hypothetical protein
MTIMLELKCSDEGFRAHPLKDRWIYSGNSRVLHVLSEDILTANVFGILKNLDPKVWLVSFLQNTCHFSREEFPYLYNDENYSEFSVLLWHDLDPPPSKLEGPTQADVFIELRNAAIIVECKGLAPLQKRVFTDDREGDPRFWWDQVVRNIVRGYFYTRKHFERKNFFFIVLSMNEKENTFTQYLNWRRLKEQVENRILKDLGLRDAFPKDYVDDICKKLSRQIRWVKWTDLKEVLQKSSFNEKGDFKAQSQFCKDIVDYLELKTKLWSNLMGMRASQV